MEEITKADMESGWKENLSAHSASNMKRHAYKKQRLIAIQSWVTRDKGSSFTHMLAAKEFRPQWVRTVSVAGLHGTLLWGAGDGYYQII